jgi:hypothetical protein
MVSITLIRTTIRHWFFTVFVVNVVGYNESRHYLPA